MEKEALKRIFDFLEEKGEQRAPFIWKLENDIPLTKEDLNVKGDLDLRYIEINSLPEGLKVGGNLDLDWSNIISLPEGLKVGGNLYIDNTPLKKYTNKELREMIKPGFIKGKIYRRYL